VQKTMSTTDAAATIDFLRSRQYAVIGSYA
jgi:hypothetical protein